MRTNPKSDRWIGVVWNESILLSAVIDLRVHRQRNSLRRL
jgi:hypothetical protein